MLNLTFYKNVPLQSSYANVVLFHSASDVLAYLSPYQEGTQTNVNKFFSNETFIDVPTYFEGCNYLCIQDTRSNAKEFKFFFIENAQFVSGGAVRYSLIMDVWATWSYDIQFKPSRMITGHADAFEINNVKRYLTSDKFESDCEISMHTPLLQKWQTTQNATIIVQGNTANGPVLLFTQVTSESELGDALAVIKRNTFKYITLGTYVTFENFKTLIINDINLKDEFDNISNDLYYEIQMGDQQIYTTHKWYYLKSEYSTSKQTFKMFLKGATAFLHNASYDDKTNRLKARYRFGTKTLSQELNINTESEGYIAIYLYLFSNYQLALYMECDNNFVNVTNEFEIPFVNDSFNLYMARNQATIDANNKAMALGIVTSLGMQGLNYGLARFTGGRTAGASLMAGAQTSSSLINQVMNIDKQQARIADASKQTDRVDGIYGAGLITLLEGVGLFKIEYANVDEINYVVNKFGTIQKINLNTYIASHSTLYNFYFVQFDEIAINGEFAYNIKSVLENIFTNGVRIWCDASQYLNNVNYKK